MDGWMDSLQSYVFFNRKGWVNGWMDGWMDGWIACDLTSFSTVFQSYQDDGWMIMKGCVQWNPIYGLDSPRAGLEPEAPLSYRGSSIEKEKQLYPDILH